MQRTASRPARQGGRARRTAGGDARLGEGTRTRFARFPALTAFEQPLAEREYAHDAVRAPSVLVWSILLVAGCSGAGGPETQSTSDTTVRASAAAPSIDKTPIPKGTERIRPRTSYPPPEQLPRFTSEKITSANLPAGLAA